MSYPVNYLKVKEPSTGDPEYDALDAAEVARTLAFLEDRNLVATRPYDPFAGQVARIRVDVYGESAHEVEQTLLAFAERCDAASQASEVSYGECVIERNLQEEWGATYSWKGRITLHPTIGTISTSKRAAAAVDAGSSTG